MDLDQSSFRTSNQENIQPRQSNSRYELLLKSKSILEVVNHDLDRQTGTIAELRDRLQKTNEINNRLSMENKRLIDDVAELNRRYDREVDKVSELQEIIGNIRGEQIKGNSTDFSSFQEQMISANLQMQDLKARLRQSEESSNNKDRVIDGWKDALQRLDSRMRDIEEENRGYIQERELLKGALKHVKKG